MEFFMIETFQREIDITRKIEVRSISSTRIRIKYYGSHSDALLLTEHIRSFSSDNETECRVHYKTGPKSILLEKWKGSHFSESFLLKFIQYIQNLQIPVVITNPANQPRSSKGTNGKAVRFQIAELLIRSAVAGPSNAIQTVLLSAAGGDSIPFLNLLRMRNQLPGISKIR